MEKNRNETRCHPFPEPLFSEDKLAFKGGVTRVSQQDWCFPKKNAKSIIPKSQIFPGTAGLPKKFPIKKKTWKPNFPTKMLNLRCQVVHFILHLRRGLLHVLRSINQRRWCFPCMTGIECPTFVDGIFGWISVRKKYGIVRIGDIMK